MSVYAINLLRELVKAGHEVTMTSQYRSDPFEMHVYGGGTPSRAGRPGNRLGVGREQDGGDFERDVDRMVDAIAAEHARQPFGVLHAQPKRLAVLLASPRPRRSERSVDPGQRRLMGRLLLRHHFQALRRVLDDANALLIGGENFIHEVAVRIGVARAFHLRAPSTSRASRRRLNAAAWITHMIGGSCAAYP